jgi:hypothetical protein
MIAARRAPPSIPDSARTRPEKYHSPPKLGGRQAATFRDHLAGTFLRSGVSWFVEVVHTPDRAPS